MIEPPIVIDPYDWAESALFEYVRKETLGDLARKGLIEPVLDTESDEPSTPTSSTSKISVADNRNLK